MSTKIYTSTNVNKWGIVEQGKTIEYETKPNHSCLVSLVGFLLVISLVVFIVIHFS